MIHESNNLKIYISKKDNRNLVLNCELKNFKKDTTVSYLACAEPDYNQSFSGSALPFVNYTMAYYQTPNSGKFKPLNSIFTINLKFPNAYYSKVGSDLIMPHVSINIKNNLIDVTEIVYLGEVAPFRLLNYPKERTSPLFYQKSNIQISQEAKLRKNAYRQI